MHHFATGPKRNYYGKGDVIVYRLARDGGGPGGGSPVFGASVLMLIYGDAFWPTYVTGDNTGLIATDSMKNFIQRETLAFTGADHATFCQFLAARFIATYPQVEGVQVSAEEVPYAPVGGGAAFAPAGPERVVARVEQTQRGVVDAVSGLRGFRLLRLGGSAFHGFVRDEYTTLPDLMDRPLHMWLDLEWEYADPAAAFDGGAVVAGVREAVHRVFASFQSDSIQQLIHRIGTTVLDEHAAIAAVHLEANNRTWDTVVEQAGARGIYTDARPPFGCLGLSLRR